eukprot:GHVS01089901.1.p1 GENE.GHVS01089901.1~~GHVS01089901.1.p1  ORF type:complete len:504 (+),score=178.65 GHVS01089901.1:998-2509(+)
MVLLKHTPLVLLLLVILSSAVGNSQNRRSPRRRQTPSPSTTSPPPPTLFSSRQTNTNPFLALESLTDSSTYQQQSSRVSSSSSGPSELMSSLLLHGGVGGVVSGGGLQENRENLNMQKYKSKPIWKTTSNSRTPGLLSSIDTGRLAQLQEGASMVSSVLSTTNSDVGNAAAAVASRLGDGMSDRLQQAGYDYEDAEGGDVFTNRIGLRCDPNKPNSRFVCMKETPTTTTTLPPTIWQKRRREKKEADDTNRERLNESYHQHRQHNPYTDAPPPIQTNNQQLIPGNVITYDNMLLQQTQQQQQQQQTQQQQQQQHQQQQLQLLQQFRSPTTSSAVLSPAASGVAISDKPQQQRSSGHRRSVESPTAGNTSVHLYPMFETTATPPHGLQQTTPVVVPSQPQTAYSRNVAGSTKITALGHQQQQIQQQQIQQQQIQQQQLQCRQIVLLFPPVWIRQLMIAAVLSQLFCTFTFRFACHQAAVHPLHSQHSLVRSTELHAHHRIIQQV